MVIGAYYLTEHVAGAPRARAGSSATRGRSSGPSTRAASTCTPRSAVRRRRRRTAPHELVRPPPGRLLFEEALPADYTARSATSPPVKKRDMGLIVEHLAENYRKAEVAEALDNIKNSATGTPPSPASPSPSTT